MTAQISSKLLPSNNARICAAYHPAQIGAQIAGPLLTAGVDGVKKISWDTNAPLGCDFDQSEQGLGLSHGACAEDKMRQGLRCRLIGNENGQSAQTPVLTMVLIGNENGRGARTQP